MITPYVAPIRGGITSFVAGLGRGLRRLGLDVHIVAREGSTSEEVEVLGGSPRHFVGAAAAVVAKIRPDFIHAHAHWYALRAALKSRTRSTRRVVFTFHTSWQTSNRVARRSLRRMLLQCDRVTFPSRFLKDEMKMGLPRDLVDVVPPGTEEQVVSPEAVNTLREISIEAGWSRTIGVVSKFEWPEKVRGFRLLLQALRDPRLSEVGVVVAGGGSLLPAVQEEVLRLGLERRIRFLGDVADPRALYTACHVYCHSSFQEGLSLALLEAMRAGAPIVSLKLPFVQEALQDRTHALLVEPTTAALADGINLLLSDQTLASTLAKHARDRACTEFDWNGIAGRFLSSYGVER